MGWMAKSLMCWSGGSFFECFNDGGGTDVQDTGTVTHATAIQGHRKDLRFDFRHATPMTVFDKKRLRGTALMLTAVPLFPWRSDAMLNHVGVLTSRTTYLEEGHDDLRHSAGQQRFGHS